MRYSREYLGRIIFIVVGAVISVASLFYSNYIAEELSRKERDEIKLWARAVFAQNSPDPRDRVLLNLANRTISIPAITIDEFMQVVDVQLVDPESINTPEKLRKRLKEMGRDGRTPIPLEMYDGSILQVFYDESSLLKSLYWFPYIQILIIGVFIGLIFITYRSTRDNEQNRIWVGMSKETAHQLGTPTTSLMGWVELFKTMPIDPSIPAEVEKDVKRLTKIVDRFSKIGSQKDLVPCNLLELAESVVDYYRSRVPKNVVVSLDNFSDEPLRSLVNPTLMEWVVENLVKNAIDAMSSGIGSINVQLRAEGSKAIIDVKDSGKGIPKQNWKRVFNTGFTTKTRGWGLGLSLSKRIVCQYHKGKIFVLTSELNVGTTFRVVLKRV